MSDIFISYARSTQPTAVLIDEALSGLGYSVWRDQALPIHRPYPQVIEERLRSAKAVVVLWSKDAAASDWVRAEADMARAADKLVQVSLDATMPPMPFNQIQCGDFVDWGGDTGSPAWGKLMASLSTLVGPPVEAFQPAPARAEGPLVAVLPFDNLSGDADLLYFSDGVSEEILQTLSSATGLKVIGRSSSFQFRGRDKGARRVAGELGCSHVLDGSVRRSGARVRISAQLIECGGQTTLWSGGFDRELSDVFALQDDIAAAVAAALKSTFAPSANAGPVDPVAYDFYLRARASNPGLYGAFDEDLLRQATERAPGFAQAWAALAITRAMHAKSGEGARIAQASEEARLAAERALALDPTSGKAYAALALLEPLCGAYAAAEALFERALAVGPDDVDVLEKYSRWLHSVGRTEAALAHITHAFRLDPLYHQGANWYAVLIGLRGRLEDAFEVWDRARARWPDFDVLVFNPLNFAAYSGDWARVEALIAHAQAHHLDSLMMRNSIDFAQNLRARRPQAGGEAIARLRKELAETGTVALTPLVAVHDQGLKDEVFDLVERASFRHLFELGGRLPNGDYGLHVLFNANTGIRDDPRFVGLCAKLGLCEYWVATGRWPDCADDVSYDFRGEARRLVGR